MSFLCLKWALSLVQGEKLCMVQLKQMIIKLNGANLNSMWVQKKLRLVWADIVERGKSSSWDGS